MPHSTAQLSWLSRLERTWMPMSAGLAARCVRLSFQPSSWRAPVREEFARALEFVTFGSLRTIVIAAGVIGVGLISQVDYWLGGFQGLVEIRETLARIFHREISPLVVGLIVLGRFGLVELSALAAMRADGTVRAMQAQGLDIERLLVMPRVLAAGLGCFAQAIVFSITASIAAYTTAVALDVSKLSFGEFVLTELGNIGRHGALILPAKTILIGGGVAAVMAVTALNARPSDRHVLASGFFRGLLTVLIVSGVLSVVL